MSEIPLVVLNKCAQKGCTIAEAYKACGLEAPSQPKKKAAKKKVAKKEAEESPK